VFELQQLPLQLQLLSSESLHFFLPLFRHEHSLVVRPLVLEHLGEDLHPVVKRRQLIVVVRVLLALGRKHDGSFDVHWQT
jgi:hypothetical protein